MTNGDGMAAGYGERTQTAANANAMLAPLHERAIDSLAPAVREPGTLRVLDLGCADGANSVGWVIPAVNRLRNEVAPGRRVDLVICGFSLEDPSRYVLGEAVARRVCEPTLLRVDESSRDAFLHAFLRDRRVQEHLDAGYEPDSTCRRDFSERCEEALDLLRAHLGNVHLRTIYLQGSFYRRDGWQKSLAKEEAPFHIVHTATADHWMDQDGDLPISKCLANLASNAALRPAVQAAWRDGQSRLLALVSEHLDPDGFLISGGLIEDTGHFPAEAIYQEIENEADERGVAIDFQAYFPTAAERTDAIRNANLYVHESAVHIQQDAYSAGEDTASWSPEEQRRVARDIRRVGESWGRWKLAEAVRIADGQRLTDREVDQFFDAVEDRLVHRVRRHTRADRDGIAPYYYLLCRVGRRPL